MRKVDSDRQQKVKEKNRAIEEAKKKAKENEPLIKRKPVWELDSSGRKIRRLS